MSTDTKTAATTALRRQWEAIATAWHGRGYMPGRNDLPAALYDSIQDGAFGTDVDLLAVALDDAWTMAEYPTLALEAWDWESYFEATGYLENCRRTEVPADIPTLFRASVRGHVGMSWTDDVETATWFHERNVTQGRDAVILKIEDAPSYAVLARFHGEDSRQESEWVLRSECTEWATELD